MARPRDWMEQLEAVVRARMFQPFAYGQQDCILFAAECVQACTGRDVWQGASYTGALDGLRLLRELGGIKALAASRLGEEISPELAAPGDVGLYLDADPEHPGLAVNVGGTWLAPSARGLRPLQRDRITTAWRCERAG